MIARIVEIAEHTSDLALASSAVLAMSKQESGDLKYGGNSVLSDFVTLVCDETSRHSQLVCVIELFV